MYQSQTNSAPDVEKQLLSLLIAHEKGSTEAERRILNLLGRAESFELPDDIVPLLTSVLKVGNEKVREAASRALASLEGRAASAVDVLGEFAIASDECDLGALSAIGALERIPGEASLKVLVRVIESAERLDSPKFQRAFDALSGHFEYLDGYLPRIKTALDTLDSGKDDRASSVFNQLRLAVRVRQSRELGELVLPGEFDFTKGSSCEEPELNLPFVEQRGLPQGKGKLVDERMRFVLRGHGDVRLEIYRISKDSDRCLVLFSEDAQSGASRLSNAIEYLASVVCSMYDLDPEQTLWAECRTVDSGLCKEDRDEYSIVVFDEFDLETCTFRSPLFEPVADRTTLFGRV